MSDALCFVYARAPARPATKHPALRLRGGRRTRFRFLCSFVDVGCNHPILESNTWYLYQRGWRGIAIDGLEEATKVYKQVRPRDTVITSLVSDVEDEKEFVVFEGSTKSTLEPNQAAVWKASQEIKETRKLRAKTLNAILNEHSAPETFELLKVDVEGHDNAVLRSIDLNRYRPLIVLVEMHHETILSIVKNEIYERLVAHNYALMSLAGYNGIFVKQ